MKLRISFRIALMTLCLMFVLVASLGYLYRNISSMAQTVGSQTALITQQSEAVAVQDTLVAQQTRLAELQVTAQAAYVTYSEMLYWRFDSAITLNERSIEQAEEAEKYLKEQLQTAVSLDRELEGAVDAMLIDLEDYNNNMRAAIDAYSERSTRRTGNARLGAARTQSMSMNAMFEVILEQATAAAKDANEGVLSSANQVKSSANALLVSSHAVSQQGENLKTSVIVIVLLAAAASAVVSLLFARSITKPIARLHRTITEIQQSSDLTRTVRYVRNDEIGGIATAFNSMLARFAEIVRELAEASNELTLSAHNCAQISQATTANIRKLGSETDAVSRAASEMTVTFKKMSDNTAEAASVASAASEASVTGRTTVADMVTSIRALVDNIEFASEVMGQLAHDSEAIGGVVDVIGEIAYQTNLLALNASIQAVQAGENGRGFAVVAREVRRLSKQSADSTHRIKEMVDSLQSTAAKAVKAMGMSKESADTGFRQSQAVEHALTSIHESVAGIDDLNQRIARAATEQSAATVKMHDNVVIIGEATRDVGNSAESTREASEELSEIASRLQSLIVQFRYH